MITKIPSEGDDCPKCDTGSLMYEVEDCTCHCGHPPCSACTNTELQCTKCGWMPEDWEPEVPAFLRKWADILRWYAAGPETLAAFAEKRFDESEVVFRAVVGDQKPHDDDIDTGQWGGSQTFTRTHHISQTVVNDFFGFEDDQPKDLTHPNEVLAALEKIYPGISQVKKVGPAGDVIAAAYRIHANEVGRRRSRPFAAPFSVVYDDFCFRRIVPAELRKHGSRIERALKGVTAVRRALGINTGPERAAFEDAWQLAINKFLVPLPKKGNESWWGEKKYQLYRVPSKSFAALADEFYNQLITANLTTLKGNEDDDQSE